MTHRKASSSEVEATFLVTAGALVFGLLERAMAIELSSTGIARSRVCALPHVHINSQGSRPSLCGVHNVEVLGGGVGY